MSCAVDERSEELLSVQLKGGPLSICPGCVQCGVLHCRVSIGSNGAPTSMCPMQQSDDSTVMASNLGLMQRRTTHSGKKQLSHTRNHAPRVAVDEQILLV